MVTWEPYKEQKVLDLQLSTMCYVDDDLCMMICPLICFYAVEYHLPLRVARQFGLKQEWLVPPFSTSVDLHKIDRQKQKRITDFETHHRQHIDIWDALQENLYENDEPHTKDNFRNYLTWYSGVTRCRLKLQWTAADYTEIQSSDDEDTTHDRKARDGTVVEAAPILDRVGNTLRQSVINIERFPRTGVDEVTLSSFLGKLSRRLRRAAGRCGCRVSVAMDVHAPRVEHGTGTSEHGAATSVDPGATSSSRATFEDSTTDDDQPTPTGPEELGMSQLPDAPSMQPTQLPAQRRRRPRDPYTPSTDALGAKGKGKGKGKARKQ
ncbi:unnamed protein product [Urochloa humidicola]